MRKTLLCACLLWLFEPCQATEPWPLPDSANEVLATYFRSRVDELENNSDTRKFTTASQWTERQSVYRTELADMLGLLPIPKRTELSPQIVSSLERDGIIVEKLHFQSLPGLYVTANLYRPVTSGEPLPAILYMCGHSVQRETIDDREISYGNKTGYQRHGAWFARHGYVCLVIDTIQWGEFLGTHWGTYQLGLWHWISMGYTPAGVETWNGIRALDYLQTRPEVDGTRIGLTGRSGGGAYTWFVAALDDRVRVAVPVAGITDLQNHVVDGCVGGHCDCMYFVNYYGWDYPRIAAMLAPRPLLIANSDRDPIFPLDGVMRTAAQTRHVYELLGADESLGLLITPGPHKDTPELQVGAFRWFDKHLKGLDIPIDEAAIERFDRKELRVFDDLPEDERVRTAEELFGEFLNDSQVIENRDGGSLKSLLVQRSLRQWPMKHKKNGKDENDGNLDAEKIWTNETTDVSWELWEYTSQSPWRLRSIVARPKSNEDNSNDTAGDLGENRVEVIICDSSEWNRIKAAATENEGSIDVSCTQVYLVPRGVGPHTWSVNDREATHIKRRFYLLGETLESMQVWDTLQGLRFAKEHVSAGDSPLILTASPAINGIAAFAAALCDLKEVRSDLVLPEDYRSSVPLLGMGQIGDLRSVFSRRSR